MKKALFAVLFFSSLGLYAQTGIGTTTPDASARLEVNASNKGFLPPRVALTASNSAGPISSPATGLMVFNTATAGTSPNNVVPGYYFWNGTAWAYLSNNAVNAMGAVSASSNTNGATISNGVLSLAPADGTNAGLLTTATQTIAGAKTFTANTAVSGTNTFTVGTGATSLGGALGVAGNVAVNTDKFTVAATTGNTVIAGTLTASGVSYPSTNGTSGQVLTTNGSGTATWATPSTTATAYSGTLPIANGGTGSSTQNFVDLTTVQTIAGAKTFSSDAKINNLTIGAGPGNHVTNTTLGANAFAANTSGYYNTSVGASALSANISGSYNTALGYNALLTNTSGANTAIGYNALKNNVGGGGNVATGFQSLQSNTTGNNNTAIGNGTLQFNQAGSGNTALGTSALFRNTASSNTAIGVSALAENTTGIQNTALGSSSLRLNVTGTDNVALGSGSLENNTASNNSALGSGALNATTTGADNTAVGNAAGIDLTTGSQNSLFGRNTGRGLITGANNTIVGANVSGLTSALSNNIILANGTGAIKAQNDGTNWALTGGLTAGGITYPNTNGTNGQVLTTNGSGTAVWATPSTTATAYSGILPVANGGTGSSTQNFVDLTTAQNVGGAKTFTANTAVSGTNTFTVGTGATSLGGTLGVTGNVAVNTDKFTVTASTGNTSVGGSLSGAGTASSTISGFSANLSTQSASYSLAASDNGKVIQFTNATAATVTLPSTLPAGFNCMIVQSGNGQLTFTGSGVTINNRNAFTKTAGQYSIVTVLYLSSSIAITSGEMSN